MSIGQQKNQNPARGTVPRAGLKGEKRQRRVSTLTKAQRKSRRKGIRFFSTVIVFAVAFALGFALRGNSALMLQLGVTASADQSDLNPGSTIVGNTADSPAARVAEIEGILNNYSLVDYELDTATTNLIQGFINSVPDKYLRYYTPARYSSYVAESSELNYSGIGVLFSEYNGQAYAVDVFNGSAAQAAGVEVGDFILAIDGDRSQNWTAAEVANALARSEGESVVVTWRRPSSLQASGGEEFTTALVCREYHEENVTASLQNDVGVIALSQITSNSSNLVSDAIGSLTLEGAKCLVLDLRDCPSGYLTQAVDICDLFIQEGIICQIQTKDGISNKTATSTVETTLPLVVLVNENTSGAAEVIAASLQENSRASVVGQTTMGKGSVQAVRELSFGGALRYTAAYYLTPLGHEIDGNGVKPDVVVASEEYQLSVAMENAISRI